jgi:hypothetical protein
MSRGKRRRHGGNPGRLRAAAVAAMLSLLLWSAEAAAHSPYGLAADGQGTVYFSDLETV